MIDPATVKGWFDIVVEPLIKQLNHLMKKDVVADIETIMLVGGFAECKYVQKRLKEELKNRKLIVPPEAGLAVVKGAVIFGQNPQIFSSRVLKYTYGIEVYDDFDETIHPKENLIFVDGKWKVENCFHIFVRANDLIPVNHCVTHFITPLSSVSVIAVYKSVSENPKYITGIGCTRIGTLWIENNKDIPLHMQEKEVTFMFGNTEIFVYVKQTETGREERLTLDCL
ncbi:hypothetical protein DPMN_055144 [Dreissena polymorpha]|uniref:Uncharacterized protein n=1 Tax=Dreissena polymorpha TaxID=45954 RepID=A0A9D4HTS5_DREPO|nr:hypothetical protein DPMN_055144 [Dreissena polymorpha]